jgi:hypothetical protein
MQAWLSQDNGSFRATRRLVSLALEVDSGQDYCVNCRPAEATPPRVPRAAAARGVRRRSHARLPRVGPVAHRTRGGDPGAGQDDAALDEAEPTRLFQAV